MKNNLALLLIIKRQENDMSLRDVAKETGISPATLSRIERQITANPDIKTVIKLALWFGVSIDYALGIERNDLDLLPYTKEDAEKIIKEAGIDLEEFNKKAKEIYRDITKKE